MAHPECTSIDVALNDTWLVFVILPLIFDVFNLHISSTWFVFGSPDSSAAHNTEPAISERDNRFPRSLLFHSSARHDYGKEVFQCSCPDGFDLVRDGECRGLYLTMNVLSSEGLATATAKCNEMQGQPPIIHRLVCDLTSKKWVWVDGSAVDFKPQSYPSDLDKDCSTEQQYSWLLSINGAWIFWTAQNSNYLDILCSLQLHQPVPSTDGCYSFDDDSEDGVCYQVGAEAENWQDAQLICRELGANLASIHNLNENSFIRRMAVSKGAVNGLFLGATISGKGNEFGWVDGTDWDYENFYPGFPMTNTGDCLAMDTSTSTGQWMNIECTVKLPVACIREKKPVIEIPEQKCDTGPYEEGALITSPGFPFNASMPCDFFLTAEEGQRIEAEIILLEANSCCDFVIIHNDFLGGDVIANLTGILRNATYTSTSNFMRVSWQPDGGVNVKGLAMTFRAV